MACQELKKILQRARVVFEERDISLDSKFPKELQARLPGGSVPQLFLNGKHMGVSCLLLLCSLSEAFAKVDVVFLRNLSLFSK
jgi:glutaredoxin